MFIGAIVHQYVFHYTDYSNSKHSDYRVNTHRRRRVVGRRRIKKGRKDSNFIHSHGSDDSLELLEANSHGYNFDQLQSDESDDLLSDRHSTDELDADHKGRGGEFEMSPSVGRDDDKQKNPKTTTFMQALIQSSLPSEVKGDALGIIKVIETQAIYSCLTMPNSARHDAHQSHAKTHALTRNIHHTTQTQHAHTQ